VDSFPVAVCHNMRISGARLFKGTQWRGYTASLRTYFYGVKVQVLTTAAGIPVEFCFLPGREHDLTGLQHLPLHLAPESRIYADNAYMNHTTQSLIHQAEAIDLWVQQRKNNKVQDPAHIRFLKQAKRKVIETTFSQIKSLFPKTIHATSQNGFLLKLLLFIVAYTFNKVFL
jgi:IS5 family transposase